MSEAMASGRTYDFETQMSVGERGVRLVESFLRSPVVRRTWEKTELVRLVDERDYQGRGIDLLWVVSRGAEGLLSCVTVEVKTDTQHATGNFFFETESVVEKGISGALFTVRSEWLFYLYLDQRELYCFPVKELRPWFRRNAYRFQERTTSSSRKGSRWRTKGRLVPRHVVLRELRASRAFSGAREGWKEMPGCVAPARRAFRGPARAQRDPKEGRR